MPTIFRIHHASAVREGFQFESFVPLRTGPLVASMSTNGPDKALAVIVAFTIRPEHFSLEGLSSRCSVSTTGHSPSCW